MCYKEDVFACTITKYDDGVPHAILLVDLESLANTQQRADNNLKIYKHFLVDIYS